MSTKSLMTVQEFAQMQRAETEDYELIEGELVPLSSGTPRRAKIRSRVERLLAEYFGRNSNGEVFSELDCRLAEDTVRRPDVAVFLSAERLQQIDLDQIPVPFAPDIAVEVLSPSEKAVDVRRRVLDYLRAGSKEVWLVDHANSEVLVHTHKGIRVLQGSDILDSPLLPEFSAAIDAVIIFRT
jgi:Uma2 family endonuclease